VSQQINLYNSALEPRRDWLSLPSLLLAWGATLAVLAVAAVITEVRVSALSAELQRENEARTAALTELAGLTRQLAARHKDAGLQAELEKLQGQLASRQDAKGVLHGGVIGNTAGFSEYLRAFARQSFDGLWLTGFSLAGAGRDLVLQGRALRPELVPGYVQRLNREAVLKGHAFAELEMQRPAPEHEVRFPTPYIEFRLATLSSTQKAEEGR
jgi:hypothetical protein